MVMGVVLEQEIHEYVFVALYKIWLWIFLQKTSRSSISKRRRILMKKLFIAVGIVAALSGCAHRIDRLNACYLCCLDRKTAEGALECGHSCKTDNRFCKASKQTVERMEAEHGK
jgi:hypothetical protein